MDQLTSDYLEPSGGLFDTWQSRDYWRALRDRKWIVLLCVGIAVAAALGLSLRTTPMYRATATVLHEGTTLAESIFGAADYGYQDPERLLQTAAGGVTVTAVAEQAKQELGSPLSVDELAAMVTAAPSRDADVILVTATSEDPQEAAAVANAFARGFVAVELEKRKANIQLARSVVEDQLQGMAASDLASNRGIMLAERAETLGIIEKLQTGEYSLSRPAEVAGSPFQPQTLRNVLLALAVGLVAGAGLAFAFEYLDRRLKTEERVEREFGLPVLAAVPAVGKGWIRAGAEASTQPVGFRGERSDLLEAYRTLRSNLQYYEVDRRLHTILVTSALPQEGKTVTTVNLALSLALSGARVIIVEADLRRPMVHTYLGLSNQAGVSNVLAGSRELSDVLQFVRVSDFAPSAGRGLPDGPRDGAVLQRNLYCAPSGPLPPNPTELVGSARMQELLTTAAGLADYVLVDSPPLLSVADAMSLARHTDAVLIAARMFSTSIDEAREVRTVLARAGQDVKAIGVVVGGVKVDRRYSHRYGYYAGDDAVPADDGRANGDEGGKGRRPRQSKASEETAEAGTASR